MRPIPAILIAITVLIAVLIGLVLRSYLPFGGSETGGFGESAIDSGARFEIEALRVQIGDMQEKIDALDSSIRSIQSVQESALAAPEQLGVDPEFFNQGPNSIIDAYAQVVLIANRREVNRGITVASPRFLEAFLGRPRETLSDECQSMTNPKLRALLVTQSVGPIRVSMLQPALDSLTRVFTKIESVDPDLYARISTAGALCVRQIRGTKGRTSTHSFGLAVDLNIDGSLDTLGDGKTQLGLTILADFFHEEGWVWGAGFTREDSMHFEVSRQQLEKWREEGVI